MAEDPKPPLAPAAGSTPTPLESGGTPHQSGGGPGAAGAEPTPADTATSGPAPPETGDSGLAPAHSGDSLANGVATTLGTLEGLARVWDGFRAGGVVYCPRESAPLALAVDAAAAAYRFVCVRCGAASPWFESGPAGLRVRSPSPTLNPGSPLGDE